MSDVAALFLFVAVATLSPGGATTLVTASGAQFGLRRSIPLIAGNVVGLSSIAAAAALGLESLVAAAPGLEVTLKFVGSAYLAWLAWRIATCGPPGSRPADARAIGFAGGLLKVWFNPKGWAMTFAAAASYGSLAATPAGLALALGGTFAIFATFSLSTWCTLGTALARMLTTDLQWRFVNGTLGLVLLATIAPMWI